LLAALFEDVEADVARTRIVDGVAQQRIGAGRGQRGNEGAAPALAGDEAFAREHAVSLAHGDSCELVVGGELRDGRQLLAALQFAVGDAVAQDAGELQVLGDARAVFAADGGGRCERGWGGKGHVGFLLRVVVSCYCGVLGCGVILGGCD
jgi:hypothetical protein